MKNKRMYINPAIVTSAMQELEKFKEEHPNEKTPLFLVAASGDELQRAAYVRAAQRLKWNVTRCKGHVYENGYFLW